MEGPVENEAMEQTEHGDRRVEIVQVLHGADERLRREGGWTKGAFARDAEGKTADYEREEACSWCLTGAVFAAAVEIEGVGSLGEAAMDEIEKTLDAEGSRADGAAAANDRAQSLEEMLGLMARTITRLEAGDE